jgi:hypothetical protein
MSLDESIMDRVPCDVKYMCRGLDESIMDRVPCDVKYMCRGLDESIMDRVPCDVSPSPDPTNDHSPGRQPTHCG